MSQAYKCDRCGKFYSRPCKLWSNTRIFITGSATSTGAIKDLCDECQKELEAWWTEKNKKNVEDAEEPKVYETQEIDNYLDKCNDDDWKDPRL